ncbi:ras-related protein Rab-33B-like isoform X2 [Sphaeramia orbicularis]|uniref:ras-related protein Rab-33B-like isoform X2 n=1 Tax=Sphaeramia orbicularis TaxID=375764 RepID=UPI00117D8631|nr:ras-related protein Rab-33B-like isoform X2 [Sphaeramia orbicularis]
MEKKLRPHLCVCCRFAVDGHNKMPKAMRQRLLQLLTLQLWDTAGQERFRKSMVQHYYRNVHAVLFIYDVTCPTSFNGLTAWMEECRQNSLGLDIPRFLVGNKSDLRGPHRADAQVSQQHAMSFAKAHRMMFFETSAKNPPNKHLNRQHNDQDLLYQQNMVEDIVLAIGSKLKRQRKPSTTNLPICNRSFRIPNKKRPEKEVWNCC